MIDQTEESLKEIVSILKDIKTGQLASIQLTRDLIREIREVAR